MAKRSTKLEALNDIFKENGIDRDSIPIRDDLIRVLKKNADAIPDYRHPSYIWHLVGDIVMIVFFALLGNAGGIIGLNQEKPTKQGFALI